MCYCFGMRKSELKIGDIVENYGFDKTPLNIFEKIYSKVKWIYKNLIYSLKKIKERFIHGFPLEEVYDLYSNAAKYLLPRIKLFRQKTNSIPSHVTEEEWSIILDKIIYSLEHHDDWISPVYPEDYDFRQEIVDISEKGVRYKRMDDRKPDFSACEEHAKKIQEGFELLGKHFTDLWI